MRIGVGEQEAEGHPSQFQAQQHLQPMFCTFFMLSFHLLNFFMFKPALTKHKQLFLFHSFIFSFAFLLFLLFFLFFPIFLFIFLLDSQPDRLSSPTDRAVHGRPGCPLSYTDDCLNPNKHAVTHSCDGSMNDWNTTITDPFKSYFLNSYLYWQ